MIEMKEGLIEADSFVESQEKPSSDGGTQKMRLEREASVQREMTQSCHPDMTQWKTQDIESRYDRSATATPYRASSVGPTMRKLEQVVSRLDDASENEAQYVF
ncbi:hypothetical protein TELCIR_05869, partial [Teladorsagia circumcincta]